MSDINVTVNDEIVNIDVIDEPVLVNVLNSPGQQGPAGQGVPVGGTEGQILAKASATNYDTEWINNYAKYLATNVRNQTGSTIAAFKVVYISGATGNKPLISLADADTEATSSKTYGVTATAIANNGTGDVVTVGELIGIDTSAFTEGDSLWLSTTAGGVVTTPPAEPAHAVFIGTVIRSHPTLGEIDVAIQNGYELNELHGVLITSAANNQGLFYNSANGLWENKSIATVLGYTPEQPLTFNSPLSRAGNVVSIPQATGSVNGFLSATDWTTFNSKQSALGYTPANAATTLTINGVTYDLSANRSWTISAGISGTIASGQVAYGTAANTIGGSNNLFWDAAQGRLGIGTNVPAQPIHIVGAGSAGAGRTWLRVQNTSTTGAAGVQLVNGNGRFAAFQYAGNGYGEEFAAFTEGDYPVIFSTSGNISSGGTAPIKFSAGGYANEGMRVTGTKSVLINTTTDDGVNRLQVSGNAKVTGSGNTSASTALTVQNSDGTNMWRFTNDGDLNIGTSGTVTIRPNNGTITSPQLAGLGITLNIGLVNAGSGIIINNINGNRTATSGVSNTFLVQNGFAPTSGTGQFNMIVAQGTINQTGGASGVTRGLYITPTLTAAADWRSIEWSNNSGWGLYGAGTANNYLAGGLAIGGSNDLTGHNIRLVRTIGGATSAFGFANATTFLSTVTTTGHGFSTSLGTQATSFNMNFLYHYRAQLAGFGSGSTVGTQAGFIADNTITGATNNYGFQGVIASGTGNWNLYMNGTAINYLNGALLLGTTTDDGVNKLQVSGNAKVTGSGNTSASTALTVQNSSSTNLLTVRNDGLVNISNGLTQSLIVTSSAVARLAVNCTNASPNAGIILQTNGVGNWSLANYIPSGTNASFVFYNDRTGTDSLFINGDTNNVGIRTNAPTARLDIPASVTTAASLRIRSGTAPTAPNDGDIWFDGTDIKMRIGGVTKTFTLV